MNNTYILEEEARAANILAPSVPVWIASTVTKNRIRKDIREFSAKVVDDGDTRIFILDETFRDLKCKHGFTIGVGCELRDDSGHYECIEMDSYQPLNKKHPKLIAKRII